MNAREFIFKGVFPILLKFGPWCSLWLNILYQHYKILCFTVLKLVTFYIAIYFLFIALQHKYWRSAYWQTGYTVIFKMLKFGLRQYKITLHAPVATLGKCSNKNNLYNYKSKPLHVYIFKDLMLIGIRKLCQISS